MCGIVAYIGPREAYPIILKGLKRLEYRGYDSAGVALLNDDLRVYKKKGMVADLEDSLVGKDLHAHAGMGHTRWATHGEPNDRNAHPHSSASGRLAMIHNGIIENFTQLKSELIKKGYHFKSDTDTEVLLNFIEDIQQNNNCGLEEAVRIALRRVVGAYVIVLLDRDNPDTIIAARKGSPLVIGIGKGEHFLASATPPPSSNTPRKSSTSTIMNWRSLKPTNSSSKTSATKRSPRSSRSSTSNSPPSKKADYDHFMLKEIFEQPDTIFDCLRGRLDAAKGTITMSGIQHNIDKLTKAQRIIIVACGTSWHAGLVAEYIFEELCRIARRSRIRL